MLNHRQLSDMTAEERTLYFLRNPEIWPNGFHLPLKQRNILPGMEPKLAMAFLREGYLLLAPGACMYLSHTITTVIRATPEDIVNAGWEVD